MPRKAGGNEPPRDVTAPPFVESRLLLALRHHYGESVMFSLLQVGQSLHSRQAWHALRNMDQREWDAVMAHAATGLLPKVISALKPPNE